MATKTISPTRVTIYGLIDPRRDELFYVGKTLGRLSDRKSLHRSSARRNSKTKVARWIRSILADGCDPDMFAIEAVSLDAWVEAEQFWIAYFRSVGCNLANHTVGGEGLSGWHHKPSSIRKTAAAHTGSSRSPEAVARMKAAWTPERKIAHAKRFAADPRLTAAMQAARRGPKGPLSDDHKKKIGNAFRGRKLTDEHKEKVGRGIAAAWTEERKAQQAERMRAARVGWNEKIAIARRRSGPCRGSIGDRRQKPLL